VCECLRNLGRLTATLRCSDPARILTFFRYHANLPPLLPIKDSPDYE